MLLPVLYFEVMNFDERLEELFEVVDAELRGCIAEGFFRFGMCFYENAVYAAGNASAR